MDVKLEDEGCCAIPPTETAYETGGCMKAARQSHHQRLLSKKFGPLLPIRNCMMVVMPLIVDR